MWLSVLVFFTNEEYQTSLLMNGSVNGPGQSVLVLTLSICGGQSGWEKLGEEVVNSNQLWPPALLFLMVAAVRSRHNCYVYCYTTNQPLPLCRDRAQHPPYHIISMYVIPHIIV